MLRFDIPNEFITGINSGQLMRYGTIIKDVATGNIVGHLKEVGNISKILSEYPIPMNPLSAVTGTINVTSNIAQNFQLREISKTLEALKMVNNIGAIASIATLGVSVAGFVVVTNKLNKLDEKLNIALEKLDVIKEILEDLKMKQEVLEFAEIKTASEQLHNALFTEDKQRRRELLSEANKTFHKYKNYYLRIAQNHNLWEDGKLPLPVANELYSRYITCVMGQLYSEFLLGDLPSFHESWKIINKEVQDISKFNKIKALRERSDNNCSNLYGTNYDRLFNEIKNTNDILCETSRRIETMDVEVSYLQDNNIKPFEYLKELREMDDGIILIPVK